MSAPVLTREQCAENASKILARGLIKALSGDPREAALRAVRPHGPSVEEIEARVRAMREAATRERVAA